MRLCLPDYVFYFVTAIDPDEYPELELLPSEEERQELVRTFCEGPKNGWSILFILAFSCLFAFSVTTVWPFRLLSPPVLLVLCGAGFPLSSVAYLRVWGRRAFPTFIRTALRRRGIPVCMGCGYDLTANVSGVCSECGMPATQGPPCGSRDATAEARAGVNVGKKVEQAKKPFRASWGWIIKSVLMFLAFWGLNALSWTRSRFLDYLFAGILIAIGIAAVVGPLILVAIGLWNNRKKARGRCGTCGRRLPNPKMEICPRCKGPTKCCPNCGFKPLNEPGDGCHKCGGPLTVFAKTSHPGTRSQLTNGQETQQLTTDN